MSLKIPLTPTSVFIFLPSSVRPKTLMGKLPQRILEHVTNQKIWLVSGGVSDRKAMLDAGFDRVVQVTPEEMPLDEAMKPEVARNNIIKAIREQFAL